METNGNSVVVVQDTSQKIPDDILESNQQILFTIVAKKPGTVGGRSAISIELPKGKKLITENKLKPHKVSLQLIKIIKAYIYKFLFSIPKIFSKSLQRNHRRRCPRIRYDYFRRRLF